MLIHRLCVLGTTYLGRGNVVMIKLLLFKIFCGEFTDTGGIPRRYLELTLRRRSAGTR